MNELDTERHRILNVLSQKTEDYLLNTEYQLETKFNKTGTYMLLFWYTHNEQNKVIVAKNEKALLATWNKVAYRYNPDLKSFWKGNIVIPPDDIRELYAKEQYMNDLRDFKYHMSYNVNKYIARMSKQPQNMQPCYLALASDHDDNCQNCNGLMWQPIDGLTWEQLFKTKKRELYSYRGKVSNKKIFKFDGSCCADPNKPLYVLQSNTNFSNGLSLNKIDKLSTSWISYEPIFFFQGDEQSAPHEALIVKDSVEQAKTKEIEQNDIWRSQKEFEYDQKEIERLKLLFEN